MEAKTTTPCRAALQWLCVSHLQRVFAGQAVVQFACHTVSKLEYAIKLFVSRAAFNDESEQYTRRYNPLVQFLPRLHALVDNQDGQFQDAFGRSMPPCIVMERGESLDKWVQRNKRAMDTFTCMQVQHHSSCMARTVKSSDRLSAASKSRHTVAVCE
jgi:hypothetical protein